MRFNEFKNTDLIVNEVSMAPNNLKKLASTINAVCGLEFEMCIPDVNLVDEDEPDFSDSPIAFYISDIVDFFEQEGFNNCSRIRNELEGEYDAYADEVIDADWELDAENEVEYYIVENDWDDDEAFAEVYKDLDYSDDEIEACERWHNGTETEEDKNSWSGPKFSQARTKVHEMLKDKVTDAITHGNENFMRAYESYRENASYPEQDDFLRSIDIHTMEDVYRRFNGMIWPIRGGGSSRKDSMDALAQEFEEMIGRSAVGCEKYHGCEKYKGITYVLEPDSSLEPEDGYAGIEIVSPKLSYPDMLSDIKDIMDWAQKKGCYTNASCGLHMNVSLDDVDISKLDYVKLVLFCGDNYVLSQFGRECSTYAHSSFNAIKHTAEMRPFSMFDALLEFQQGLIKVASNIIQHGETTKMVSVGKKSNRIEFRSPGNNWLEDDYEKLVATLSRFVVAYDIACDPDKHKEEYAKKLYKIINPSTEGGRMGDAIAAFTKYNAGLMYKSTLKNILSQRRVSTPTTIVDKTLPKPADNQWVVTTPTNEVLLIPASSAAGAINQARANLKLNSIRYPSNTFAVEPYIQTDVFKRFGQIKHPAQDPTPADDEQMAYNIGMDHEPRPWQLPAQRDLFKRISPEELAREKSLKNIEW